MIHTLFDAVHEGSLELVKKAITCHDIIDENWSDYKLLAISLKQRHKEIIELLLNNGCRVQRETEKKVVETPLFYAIRMQDVEILKLLLNKGISFAQIDHTQESLFEIILDTSNKEIISLILAAYVKENINPIDKRGFSLFHIACYLGDISLVEKFLNSGRDINSCVSADSFSFAGFSPLHFAVESGCPRTVEILLLRGADITIKNSNGKSSFYLACLKKIRSVKDLLMIAHYKRNINSVDDEGFSILHKDLFYKHMIHFNISYTVEFEAVWTSWTPLHYAVGERKTEIVRFLLQNKADVNVKDALEITPLHLACQYTFEELSKIVSNSLQSPLSSVDIDSWILNQNEQIKIVKLLLEYNSDVNAREYFGKTPLFHALENFVKICPIKMKLEIKVNLIQKRKELIHLLLKYGADVNISDNEGVTILHDLSEYDVIFYELDKVEMAKLILSKGADINAKTKANKTPLFLSIRNKFVNLAELLISYGADINCTCNVWNNFTPLHALTYYSEYNSHTVNLLNMLLENGANVHAREVDEATALHIAIDCHGIERNIRDDDDQMALSLLKFGAEVDASDRNGQTPLHRACLNRYTIGAKGLLNHGADINIEDEFGNTPLSLACYRVQEESNTVFFSLVRHHIHKLKFIKFYVSEKNKLCLLELEKFYAHRFKIPKIDQFLSLCSEEVIRMKSTKIDHYTSLYNILFKSPNEMATHVKNEKFEQILKSPNFEREFELYGYLLTLQFSRGKSRRKLLEPLKESFKQVSKCELPYLCLKMIFEHLSDCDLKILLEALNI